MIWSGHGGSRQAGEMQIDRNIGSRGEMQTDLFLVCTKVSMLSLLTLTSWIWKLLHLRCGENLRYLESGNCYISEDLEKISNFLKSKGC
jgi:hypothetical protein